METLSTLTPCLIETPFTGEQETVFFLSGHHTTLNDLVDFGHFARSTKRF